MGHLLYLIFRCDFDVMENLETLGNWKEVNTAYVSCVAIVSSEKELLLASSTSSPVLLFLALRVIIIQLVVRSASVWYYS